MSCCLAACLDPSNRLHVPTSRGCWKGSGGGRPPGGTKKSVMRLGPKSPPAGSLVLPGFFNLHFHADKCLLGEIMRPNQSGTLPEAIEITNDFKRNYDPKEVAARAGRVLEAGRPGDQEYDWALADFDFWLRGKGRHTDIVHRGEHQAEQDAAQFTRKAHMAAAHP